MFFVKDMLFADQIEFSKEAFDEVFAQFDDDGSGSLDKGEMVGFIKALSKM